MVILKYDVRLSGRNYSAIYVPKEKRGRERESTIISSNSPKVDVRVGKTFLKRGDLMQRVEEEKSHDSWTK